MKINGMKNTVFFYERKIMENNSTTYHYTNQLFGGYRFIFNYLISFCKENIKKGITTTKEMLVENIEKCKSKNPWIAELFPDILQFMTPAIIYEIYTNYYDVEENKFLVSVNQILKKKKNPEQNAGFFNVRLADITSPVFRDIYLEIYPNALTYDIPICFVLNKKDNVVYAGISETAFYNDDDKKNLFIYRRNKNGTK